MFAVITLVSDCVDEVIYNGIVVEGRGVFGTGRMETTL